MNLDTDFTFKTLQLTPDYEGEVTATFISSNRNLRTRKSVLYLHGYNDYFFHPHLAEKFNDNSIDFYALDLRKYGRSLLKHQHPNYCKNIEEYFEEISIAITEIDNRSRNQIYLLGHSTGGLIASNYMNTGCERNKIDALILNSPFFDLYQSEFEKFLSYWGSKIISSIAPYAKIEGALAAVYAQSLHKDFYGEWDFNLDWKPIKGFPTYLKWVVAIINAQKKLANSNIKVPILIMHSSDSKKMTTFTKEAISRDTVLNIEDIKRVGATLGDNVTLLQIDNALHDIFLSPKPVRDSAFDKMLSWLSKME
ncbi:alpha/beta hydrolase [Flavobacterium hiemivividum]|uniref:Alpha/beta hydrolase n=2 Tax=Flavobacterium hiemivividum TaxID=2541734 RepID=A0A4R5CVS9_9FLAO|nr:alpha/beta hydrolase [Flavobacterium hiemivividum]